MVAAFVQHDALDAHMGGARGWGMLVVNDLPFRSWGAESDVSRDLGF